MPEDGHLAGVRLAKREARDLVSVLDLASEVISVAQAEVAGKEDIDGDGHFFGCGAVEFPERVIASGWFGALGEVGEAGVGEHGVDLDFGGEQVDGAIDELDGRALAIDTGMEGCPAAVD